MIQLILFFALGFFCAGFIALLVAPLALQRAARLTRKHIEASMPLTPTEIQADKDHTRAEAAMSIRRLEMNVASLRDRTAVQLVDIGRGLEEIKALTAESNEKTQAIAALEAQCEALRADLARRDEDQRHLSARLAEAESAKAADAEEFERLGAMYDEASFASSSRQIELIARESEVEKLAGTVLQLKAQRKDADARAQAMALEARAVREELKIERKRANDLEKKIERLTSRLGDGDDKLKGHDKDQLRLLENDNASHLTEGSAAAAPGATELFSRPAAAEAGIDEALAKLSADRERLEERLTRLARENKRLKGSAAGSADAGSESAEQESAQLREQMNALAAEVVNLTAMLDGPDSPIIEALATQDANEADGATRPFSLADRVRALQKAGSTG